MAKRTEIPKQSIRLKERVEKFLNSNLKAIKKIPPADIRNLFEDLQIYQTELENHSKVWRESEERLRDFINSATDSFVLFDPDLNIVKVNEAHMEMFHPTMNKEDLIGKNLLDIVPNLKETGRFDDFMGVLETGSPYFANDIVPHNKFGNRILSVKAFKMANGLGTITRDITEQKLAEKKYKLLADNVTDVIYVVSLDKLKVEYVSPSIESVLGYTVEGFRASNISDLLLPSSYDLVMEKITQELEKDKFGKAEPQSLELDIMRKDGLKICVGVSARFLRDDEGHVTSILCVARDVSEQKQAENELKESELKHKTLVNNIPGMAYRAYPDWSAEVFSGGKAVSGYTEEELNSQVNKWLDIVHPDDKKRIIKDGSELLKDRKNIIQTYRIKNKSGDIRWVEDRKTSVFSEEGEFLGIDGVVFDITNRKKLEDELLEAKSALEEKVKERTAELNEKNIALKVLLEQGEEAKNHLEEIIMSNVNKLVMPNITRLRNSTLTSKQQTTLNVLEANLNEIVSPFSETIDSKFMKLTPTEIQVANYIKHGASSKEIAESLSLSQRTVDTHRYNIRKKLGVRGKGINLRTYLSSLS